MPTKKFDKYLQTGKSIKLTTMGPQAFKNMEGYVGEVTADSFEFKVFSNSNNFEHYSNISAPQEFRVIQVSKSEIKKITI